MPTCVLCDRSVERWLPDPDRDTYSPMLRALDVVGADGADDICPACGGDGRERHAWLYLTRSGILERARGLAALHIGGEPRLRGKLATAGPRWTFVDGEDPATDLEALAPGSFRLIVCNRVLARVDDVGAAIRALGRCLADDGQVVAQCAYSPLLTTTLALMRPANDRAAQLLFGDRRARRLFGADLPAAFEAASLPGRALAHAEVLPGVDGATWGCNPREPLFVYGRQRCPSFRS